MGNMPLYGVLVNYLDTYSQERISMATGSLDSTTSRSNLLSVWHCVSDSLRCFDEQTEDSKDALESGGTENFIREKKLWSKL